MLTIALCGQKGGAGKSTASFAIACEYLRRGLTVLLVDADPQGSLRTWAAAAGENSNEAPSLVSMGAGMHLPQNLPRVAKDFDRVVIDCPPRSDAIQRSALMACDLAVLPCGPQAFDIWALADSIAQVVEAQALRPSLRAGILVNKKQGQTVLGRNARTSLQDLQVPLLGTEWGYRVAFAEASALGTGVTTYAPHDPAADECKALVDEIDALMLGKKKVRRHA